MWRHFLKACCTFIHKIDVMLYVLGLGMTRDMLLIMRIWTSMYENRHTLNSKVLRRLGLIVVLVLFIFIFKILYIFI